MVSFVDTVTLPGVFRDLFRKSGRPIDRVIGLDKTVGRSHLFKDGSRLDLPLGNRGDQHEAVMALFGEDEWSPWVDQFAEPERGVQVAVAGAGGQRVRRGDPGHRDRGGAEGGRPDRE